MASEDRYKSLEERGVGSQRCQLPNATEGGPSATCVGFRNSQHSQSLGFLSIFFPNWMLTQLLGSQRQCVTIQLHPTTNHKTKCMSVWLVKGYYGIGVTAIPQSRFRMMINIISKEDNSYRVRIGGITHFTCPNFTKSSSHALGKK